MEQDHCGPVVAALKTELAINSAPTITQKEAIVTSRNLEIVIEIYGLVQQSFQLLIDETVDAKKLSQLLATKLNFLEDERKYYTVVLVYTKLHPVKQYMCHYVKTLRENDLVLDIYDATVDKMFSKYGEPAIGKFRWFYKDVRSIPLSLCDDGGYMSGDSSEDEEEITPSDLAYIRQADKRAYLLKRSSRDPNVWKRRYCILTDKFWCVNTKLDMPRAICIPLNSSVMLQDSRPSYNYPNAIVIHDANCVHYYRAPTPAEQQNWIQEFHYRISFQIENETINLAEFITCDEEYAACVRSQKASASIMDSDVFKYALADVSNERVLSTSAWQIVPSSYSPAITTGIDVDRVTSATEHAQNHFAQPLVTSSANTSGSDQPNSVCGDVKSEPLIPVPTLKLTTLNRKPASSGSSSTIVQSNVSQTTDDADTTSVPGSLSKSSHKKLRRVYSSYSTPSSLQLRVQRRGILSLLDGMRERHPSLFRALQFLQAVQYYKDMHRHDITREPREIWMSLIAIYHMYLEELLIALALEPDQELPPYTSHTAHYSSSSRSRSPGESHSRRGTSKETPMATLPEDPDGDEPSWYEVGCDEDTIWNISIETISEIRDHIESRQYKAQLSKDGSSQIGSTSDTASDTLSKQLVINNQRSSTGFFSSWLGLSSTAEISTPSQSTDTYASTTSNSKNRNSKSSVDVSGRQKLLNELEKHYQKYANFDFDDSIPSPSLFDSLQQELIQRVSSCVDSSPGDLFREITYYDEATSSNKQVPPSVHSSTDVRQQKKLFDTMFQHTSGKSFRLGGGIKDLIAIASGRRRENTSARSRQDRQERGLSWKSSTSRLNGFPSSKLSAYQRHLSSELAGLNADTRTWRTMSDDYLPINNLGYRSGENTIGTSKSTDDKTAPITSSSTPRVPTVGDESRKLRNSLKNPVQSPHSKDIMVEPQVCSEPENNPSAQQKGLMSTVQSTEEFESHLPHAIEHLTNGHSHGPISKSVIDGFLTIPHNFQVPAADARSVHSTAKDSDDDSDL